MIFHQEIDLGHFCSLLSVLFFSLSFHPLLPISFSSLLSPSLPLHFSVFLNALVSFKSVSESITFPGGKATFGSWLQEEVSAAAHNALGLMSRQTSQQGGWGSHLAWRKQTERDKNGGRGLLLRTHHSDLTLSTGYQPLKLLPAPKSSMGDTCKL